MPILMDEALPATIVRLGDAGARATWAFLEKLRSDLAHPGLSLERINETRDPNFWSARVSQDLRAVLHREGSTTTLLYIGHHNEAYKWASTHTYRRDAVIGTLQVFSEPRVVAEQLPPRPPQLPGLFDRYTDAYLESLGLPPEWIPVMRAVSDEGQLLTLTAELPGELGDRLLQLADGELVAPPLSVAPVGTRSTAPLTGVYLVDESTDLQRLMEAPLEAWLVFLHPSQQRFATGRFNGPLKVTGSAGTGKTVVALHRARHLAAQGRRVLLTSFVRDMCAALERGIGLLCEEGERERITVSTVHQQALSLLQAASTPLRRGPTKNSDVDELLALFRDLHRQQGCTVALDLVRAEWNGVIQPQGLMRWEEYRRASRAGRGTPLSVRNRKEIWGVAEALRAALERNGAADWPDLCHQARLAVQDGRAASPFDAVIVDEVQDLGPQELLLLHALVGPHREDGLTLVGDAGQRLYPGAPSLKSLGIDVRGRSHVLRLNYRTTREIRRFAERILGGSSDDLDGGEDDRRRVQSLIGGPEPSLHRFSSAAEQSLFVAHEIAACLARGLQPQEIAVFARTNSRCDAIRTALQRSGQPTATLGDRAATSDGVVVGTMHRAKGLEYKIVFVVDLSDEVVPLRRALVAALDAQEQAATLDQERHLLYVSVTRARDAVYLTWVGKPSRFLPLPLSPHPSASAL